MISHDSWVPTAPVKQFGETQGQDAKQAVKGTRKRETSASQMFFSETSLGLQPNSLGERERETGGEEGDKRRGRRPV